MLVDAGVEDASGPEEDVPEHRLDRAHDRDVPDLRAGPEPFRRRQRLQDGQPHDRAAREEAEMLERVHGVVAHGRLVEERQMPDVEVHRPERQGDQRIGEEAQAVQEGERRPQDRACQPREQRERREISEQDVLQHVEAEELFAERMDRADERDEEQRDAGREESDPPAGNMLSRGRAASARDGRTATASRTVGTIWSGSNVQLVSTGRWASTATSLPSMQLFHYHLVTSKVREVEARYIGKLGFDLVARHGRIDEDTTSFESGHGWDELDQLGFKLRLSELERGAVNVVVQPGQWELPRIDHLGFALDEDDFVATLARAELRELRVQEHGGRRTFVSTRAGYRLELHPPREWLDDFLDGESDLKLAELQLRADDPELKAASLGELLEMPYTKDTVTVGETLVRFLPDGPQGRPQLHAELFV